MKLLRKELVQLSGGDPSKKKKSDWADRRSLSWWFGLVVGFEPLVVFLGSAPKKTQEVQVIMPILNPGLLEICAKTTPIEPISGQRPRN